jgi:lipooligosaccharide transport system ATP-binding protein
MSGVFCIVGEMVLLQSGNAGSPAFPQQNNMSEMIRARGLTKRFPGMEAVKGIDFSVEEGECFGLLGPNGAGKTSTIRMITCVSPVTDGELLVNGMDVNASPRKIKARLGVVSQEENLDPDLSVQQNLEVYARYFDIGKEEARRRANEVLELFQLDDRRREIVDNLSGGMKRRLIIARALMSEPTMLVLDEPTTGLDPQARHVVWRKLKVLLAQGITMLLTTHYMDEAAQLCDRIVVMHLGEIMAEGTPMELIDRYAGRQVLEVRLAENGRNEALTILKNHDGLEIEGELEDVIYVFKQQQPWEPLLEDLAAFRQHCRLRDGTLEDVFLRLTGRGLFD